VRAAASGSAYSVCESTCLPARRRTIEIPSQLWTGMPGAGAPLVARQCVATRSSSAI
jgi:hypothetical protein